MKNFLHFLTLLLVVTALDYPIVDDWKWIDDRADRTKVYFTIYYIDGSYDTILMDQKTVGTPEMYDNINKIVEHKEQTWQQTSK